MGVCEDCGNDHDKTIEISLERYAALGIAGISIGSNDFTQLMLAADRDSELVAEVFDERDPAVADHLRQLIPRARALGLQTSICGQAPSVDSEYAELLVSCGIDAISVNIDVVDRTRRLRRSRDKLRIGGPAGSTKPRPPTRGPSPFTLTCHSVGTTHARGGTL